MDPLSVFEKYEWREVEELLSRSSCSWVSGGEDLLQPVDPPPGMVTQLHADCHPSVCVLAPCDPGVCMDYRVVHQIIRELTLGIYCFNQVPSISLEPNADHSSACHLTPAYRHTRVGQILLNIHYTMKSLWHGASVPTENRAWYLQLWRASRGPEPVPDRKSV